MRRRHVWAIVTGVAAFILGAGLTMRTALTRGETLGVAEQPALNLAFQDADAGQETEDGGQAGVVQSTVASALTYQGRVTNAAGAPLNGPQSMRFLLYNVATGGSPLWDSDNVSVPVDNGLFTIELEVDQAHFNGQALWLRVDVNGQTLSPRQSLHPTPYALSLRPGADITGEPASGSDAVLGVTMQGSWPSGQALLGSAPATGTAMRAQAGGGQGLYASSNNMYAVRGSSDASWGGYFTSNEGYGLVASTGGTDHWDHAGVFQAVGGYGLYSTSSNNMAIRGEAGDTTGLWQPVGAVGLVGIGQSRGVYGSSGSSYGVYATSLNWYGVYGRTSRVDNNFGLYTPDNLFAANTVTSGSVMNVVQNGGDEPLQPGDVVVFSGIGEPLSANDTPVIQVARPTEANNHAVAGVVHSRFNIDVARLDIEEYSPDLEVAPVGAAPPGEYLLLVVQGPAQVRVSANEGTIQPGDLLAAGGAAGRAAPAPLMSLDGAQVAVPGTVFAKALEPSREGQEMIYVFVTLQ